MKVLKMKPALAAVSLVLALSLFSCGKSGTSAAKDDGPRHKLTMMANFNQPEPPRDTSDLMQYLRNTLKADIQISWYPTPVYMDTLGMQIAANDLPDTVVVRGNIRPANVVSAVRDGMFWEVDKYLNNPAWPGLAKLSKDRLVNARIEGKSYALPIERELVQAGVLYRTDWLEKLGLAEPKNIEDIWNIMVAFSERDPDGNGKRDTVGLSMKGTNWPKVTDTAVYFGGQMEWYWDEATQTAKHETEDPAFYKSLDLYREAYAKNYMVQDVVELRNEYLPLEQGRAGLVFFSDINDVVDAQIRVSTIFPEARIGFTQQIQGPDGSVVSRSHIGFNGGFVFPKTSIKTEARLEEVLKFFDALGSDDAILTLRRGIKDKHYTVENGYLVATDAQIKAFRETDFPDASLISPFGVTRIIPERLSDPLTQATFDSMANYNGKRFLSISDTYISDTAVKLGNTLSNIIADARVKYVLGQIDLAAYQAEVARWRAAGGDQLKAEYTAAYKASPR
ncbi:putative ABC transporter peptide-binding protein YtcQ [Spirochaetia bacterium]|nr:putative ABC transporter peptide-binding protein YtcQ [Spirochaetia bacterium]GHV49346.1 putative ABC transporter peptide-binding protein YtcQ [Spirochaetia bacterium]